MPTPIQLKFHGIPPSDALRAAVRAEAAALERYFDRFTSCHVTVSEPHRHQHQGRLYRVNIHMAVPGDELAGNHEHDLHAGHEDPYLAVRGGVPRGAAGAGGLRPPDARRHEALRREAARLGRPAGP